MRKSVAFFEKVFTDKFYINGIDVFDENNVELLKYINIDLGIVSSDSKIDNAKLYIVKELGIKIVIAKKEDYAIVCYPNYRTFLNSANHPRHKESQLLNLKLLEEFVIQKLKNSSDDSCVYSPDYKTRAVITTEDKLVSVKYQALEVLDIELDYFYEGVNSNNFWTWEDLPGVSYFDSVETAKKEATVFLAKYLSEPRRRFTFEPDNVLWSYQLSRSQTWLYMMSFAMAPAIIWVLLSCLFPLFGQSNWNILYLSGGSSLFALILGGIATGKNCNCVTYEITDKGIRVVKGTFFETTFDNIKKVKIRRNLFDKNKGSIKFKLRKGLALNYNFDNIEHIDDAYKILAQQMEAFVQQNSN